MELTLPFLYLPKCSVDIFSIGLYPQTIMEGRERGVLAPLTSLFLKHVLFPSPSGMEVYRKWACSVSWLSNKVYDVREFT